MFLSPALLFCAFQQVKLGSCASRPLRHNLSHLPWCSRTDCVLLIQMHTVVPDRWSTQAHMTLPLFACALGTNKQAQESWKLGRQGGQWPPQLYSPCYC